MAFTNKEVSHVQQSEGSISGWSRGLIVISFIVMIGYKIGSQSISKQTENQIREEANKLLTKINCKN